MTAHLASIVKSIIAIVTFVTMMSFTTMKTDAHDLSGSALVAATAVVPATAVLDASAIADSGHDRIWLISTRHLTSNVCCANLDSPSLVVSQLDTCGRRRRSTIEEYRSKMTPDRSTVVYVHGNRTTASCAVERGLTIYRYVARHRPSEPVDWIIWSWPSDPQHCYLKDARIKAGRTDAHGMYLAWFLRDEMTFRNQVGQFVPPTMIGYSFGGRIVTGSLHALAGGRLGGRQIPGPQLKGQAIRAGLVAPAIERNWLLAGGYHGEATKNLDRMVLMYNHRDAILKRYWLVDRVRSSVALGYSGPNTFAPRFDGSRLPVVARDFAQIIGFEHDELVYYQKDCRASSEMARLIHEPRSSVPPITKTVEIVN